MKVTATSTGETPFQPIRITIDCETENELGALTKMGFYTGSIPTVLRRDGQEYPAHKKLTDPEHTQLARFLSALRTATR